LPALFAFFPIAGGANNEKIHISKYSDNGIAERLRYGAIGSIRSGYFKLHK